MAPWTGGFIPIIFYSSIGGAVLNDNQLLTENDLDILTENSETILIESA